MRKIYLAAAIICLFVSETVLAYGGNYGYGAWGGAQGCGYNVQASGSIYSKDAEYADLDKTVDKTKTAYDKAKKKFKDKEGKVKAFKKKMKKYFKTAAADFIYTHIVETKPGVQADGYKVTIPAAEEGGTDSTQIADECGDSSVNGGVPKIFCSGEGRSKDRIWTGRLANNGGSGEIDPEVACIEQVITTDQVGRSDSYKKACRDALTDLMKLVTEKEEAEQAMIEAEAELSLAKDERDLRKEQVDEEVEDGSFKETAGGWCPICNNGVDNKTYLLGTILGVAGSLYGVHQTNKAARYISDVNAGLGWPTQPYLASGMAYPYIAQSFYGGMMGGMGAGGFGCSGGYYGGLGPFGMGGMGGLYGAGLYGPQAGAFGYPPWMFGNGPWGGGPYMPGMGPWGIAGPMGGGGYYPGMGMAMGGAIGFAYGGYPASGYPMGMAMGGYPGGGYPGGGFAGGFGYAGGGYPGGIGFAGGVGIAGGGYPMGMAMGGYPGGMGYPMGGYAMAGAMGGYPMGGMAMGGYQMGMAMGGGFAFGTPPFMPGAAIGAMGGLPMGGMQMGGMAMGGMQMQQAYMQQYMQQMQMQMQMYQQQQQDWMQKQQIVGRLTEELYRIQQQIMTITSGSYGVGVGVGTGYNYFGVPGAGVPWGTSNTGTIPAGTGSSQRILGR